MKDRKLVSGLFLLCVPLFGCSEDIDSDDVRTSGFYADFSALATGNGSTTVSARLKTGGENSNTFADLQAPDTLVASTDDEDVTMSRRGSGNRAAYEAVFDTDEAGTEFNIAFLRGDLDDDAPDSQVTLPDPFTPSFEDIDRGDEVERGTRVDVLWDNDASGQMSWSVEGDCVWSESGTVDDDGSLSLADDDIRVQSLNEGEDCEVTITLERRSKGTTDAAFGGGKFEAVQRRTLTFVSTPSEDEGGMGGSQN